MNFISENLRINIVSGHLPPPEKLYILSFANARVTESYLRKKQRFSGIIMHFCFVGSHKCIWPITS